MLLRMNLLWSKLLLGCFMIWTRSISVSAQTTDSTHIFPKTTSSMRTLSVLTTPEQTVNETYTPTQEMVSNMSTANNGATGRHVTTTSSMTGGSRTHYSETNTGSGGTNEVTDIASTVSAATSTTVDETNNSDTEQDYEYYENDVLPFPNGWCVIDILGEELHPVYCNSDQYCCGKTTRKKCCPKVPSGAVFGMVSSAVVISIFAVCCIVASCLWCDVCPYRKARLRKKMSLNQAIDIPPEDRHTQYTVKDETVACHPDSSTFRSNNSIPDEETQGDKGDKVADGETDMENIEALDKEAEVNLLGDTQL